jgi:hypothetical protein
VLRDMFGRPLPPKPSRKRAAAEGGGPLLRFKFHEGLTNAVRRTVRVQDLF